MTKRGKVYGFKTTEKRAIGVKRVKYKPCGLAVEEPGKMSDMTCEQEPEISISKTMLSKAQLQMRDIEELLDWCTSTDPCNQSRCRTVQRHFQANIEEDGETLSIEGFRFLSATSKEDLRRLCSQAPVGGRRMTHD